MGFGVSVGNAMTTGGSARASRSDDGCVARGSHRLGRCGGLRSPVVSPERAVRAAAKVILVVSDESILLFRGGDPARPEAGTWWFPPGGGVEPGDTMERAARREVREETGLVLGDLGPVAHCHRVEFRFDGRTIVSDEAYFVVRVDRCDISTDGWTDLEREVVVEHRWWTLEDLRTTTETVYPEDVVWLVETFGRQ